VATATGLTGMSGYLGATLFTLLFGILVTQIGYGPCLCCWRHSTWWPWRWCLRCPSASRGDRLIALARG
jgi:MFS family permease